MWPAHASRGVPRGQRATAAPVALLLWQVAALAGASSAGPGIDVLVVHPEAFHNNVADPAYGLFFGQRGRRFTADFDVVF